MENQKKKILINKCPVCGGQLIEKIVEKLLRGGNNIASIKTVAQVCLGCGEQYYTAELVKEFEKIRKKLQSDNPSGLRKIGTSYTLTTNV